MSHEKYLVIGSNSFTGASFVAGLLADGSEVLGISRSPEADPVFLPYKWSSHDHFTFRQLDLNRDLDTFEASLNEFQPDYVVNFAAQGMVAQSWQNPEHWYQTNTIAMIRLHERLRKYAGLKKFVHASTPEVYGNTAGVIREDAPFNPSTPYAISKAACDMNLLASQRTYGFPVAMTRAANVCGPGQALYRIIPKTILCILAGRKLRLEGGGASVRSFIHVRDVVDATIRICRHGAPGAVYHLSTERRDSIRALVEETCRQLGARFEDCVEIAEARLAQDSAYLLESSKAREELGWLPKQTVCNAIRDTADWIKQNLAELRDMPDQYVHKE
jgi:dTDP-glucose 4,6-dehydratase